MIFTNENSCKYISCNPKDQNKMRDQKSYSAITCSLDQLKRGVKDATGFFFFNE